MPARLDLRSCAVVNGAWMPYEYELGEPVPAVF